MKVSDPNAHIPRVANTIPVVINLVTLHDMHCARDFRGEILHTQDGEISAVDVIFSDVQFRHFKTRFWLTENSRWVLDKFCTALLISTKTQSVKSDQVIGKKLYIWIG